MATTGALAKATGARMIMGLNLAADDPALDAAELRDYVAALPQNAIEAVEIGNEPNVYNKLTVYHTASGGTGPRAAAELRLPPVPPQFQADRRPDAAAEAGRRRRWPPDRLRPGGRGSTPCQTCCAASRGCRR